MKNLLNLRTIIIACFIVIIVIGIGYKYYEWSTIQTLQSLYNQTTTQELSLAQDESKNSQTYAKHFKKIFNKDFTPDSLITSYDHLYGDLKLVISNEENSQTIIQQNQNMYTTLNTTLLFGKRGDFAKSVVREQKQLYQYQLKQSDISYSYVWLFSNILMILKDRAVAAKFESEVSPDYKTLTPQHWSELSPLQKYTDSSFSFKHQNDIKKYYPKAYTLLNKYKEYLANYYSTMQDAVNGDTQSVSYKLPVLQQSGTSLNVDLNEVFNEAKDQSDAITKNAIETIVTQSILIKDFNSEGLYKYPLLANINRNWKVDLTLCGMYAAKAGLYHEITTNYVTASSSAGLVDELRTTPPYTQVVDNKFDKNALRIENTDSAITYTCVDTVSKTNYQVSVTK